MLRYEAISSQDFSTAAMICILILLSKEIDSEFNSYRRNQCKEGSIEFSLIVYTAQCQLKCLKAQDKCKMLFGIIPDLCMCLCMCGFAFIHLRGCSIFRSDRLILIHCPRTLNKRLLMREDTFRPSRIDKSQLCEQTTRG